MKVSPIVYAAALTVAVLPAQAKGAGDHLYISSIPAPALPLPAVQANKESNQPGYQHYQKGLNFKQRGDTNLALIEFLEASKENPRLTKAFYEQALIFRQKGFSKLAESALNQALALAPDFQQARILQAAVRLEAGNVGGAASSLSKSLGLDVKKSTQPQAKVEVAKDKAATYSITPATATATKVGPAKVDLAKVDLARATAAVNDTALTATARTLPVESKKSTAGGAASGDPWTERLRYLNEHGTATLQPGEAFMFSEETGEAVLFLADGKKIRRSITVARDNSDLVKERRPELLVPKEYVYKLSTQGRMLGADTVVESSENLQEQSTAVKKPAGNFFAQDHSDNAFTRNPLPSMEEFEDKETLPTVQPVLKTAASEAAKDLLKDPDEFGESDRSFAKSGSLTEQFGMEAIVEKTQKFFGWVKKSLHLP